MSDNIKNDLKALQQVVGYHATRIQEVEEEHKKDCNLLEEDLDKIFKRLDKIEEKLNALQNQVNFEF